MQVRAFMAFFFNVIFTLKYGNVFYDLKFEEGFNKILNSTTYFF